METREESKSNSQLETIATFTGIEGHNCEKKTNTSVSKTLPSTTDTTEEGASKAPEVEYVTGFKLVILLGSLTMACSLMLLDTSVVVTAIPRITDQFHSTTDIGWYGSAYLLTSCSLQPLTGKLYQNFSLNYIFIFFIGIFELGSLICGVAVSSNMLIVGRAVAGMGGSGIVNGTLTIISTAMPAQKRPTAMGIIMGVANIASALGPLIGGAFTQYATWRWCFYINLPCGAVVVGVILACRIPESYKAGIEDDKLFQQVAKLDLLGFTLFAPAIIMLLLAINWGGTTYPWTSGTEIGLFVGAGVMFGIFLTWEHHVGASALIPLVMFKNKVIVFACTVHFFAMSAYLITIYYIPEWFQAVVGKSPTLSGVYILPLILSQMVTATVGGALISRVGYYLPFAIMGYAISAIGTGFITTFLPSTSTVAWIGYQIMTGARGMVPIIAVQNQLPKENIAVGISILVFIQTLGGATSLSFAQLLFKSTLAKQLAIQVPTVSAEDILSWGATGFQRQVSAKDFPAVLNSYDKAITTTLYLSVGFMCGSFMAAWGLGWKSVKMTKAAVSEA